jgi:pantoate kinase
MSNNSKGVCYKGSIGIGIVVETGIDLNASTSSVLNVKKPQGSEVVWDADVYQITKVSYVTEEDDLDEVGLYYIQAKIEFGDNIFFGETTVLQVRDRYK